MNHDKKPPINASSAYTNLEFRVLLRPLRKGRAVLSITRTFDFISVLSTPKLKSTFVQTPSFPIERRRSPRLHTKLEAEMVVSLLLLDTSSDGEDDTLLLLGETQDVSVGGLSIVVPAIRIDEKYCAEARPLTLSLRLDPVPVQLTLETIHCERLRGDDPDQGYIIGGRITDFGRMGQIAWRRFLDGIHE